MSRTNQMRHCCHCHTPGHEKPQWENRHFATPELWLSQFAFISVCAVWFREIWAEIKNRHGTQANVLTALSSEYREKLAMERISGVIHSLSGYNRINLTQNDWSWKICAMLTRLTRSPPVIHFCPWRPRTDVSKASLLRVARLRAEVCGSERRAVPNPQIR